MCYTIDEIGEDYVVVDGERIKVFPSFEILPDKIEYETWLNEVMADVIETVGSRAKIPNLQDHLAQVAQGWGAD